MAKTPRTRHSTPKREPLTIDLEAVRADPATEEASPPDSGANAGTKGSDRATPADALGAHPHGSFGDDPVNTQSEPEAALQDTPSYSGDDSLSRPSANEESSDDGRPGAPSDAAKPRAARSGSAALLGGVSGGLIALALAGLLQYSGVLPGLGGAGQTVAEIDQLKQDLAGVQDEVAQLRGAMPANDGPTLDQALAEPRAAIAQLQQSVQSLEERVGMTPAPGDGDTTTALEQRLTELESRLQASSQGTGPSDLTEGALVERLQSAEAQISELRDTIRSASNDDRQAVADEVNEAVSAANMKIDEVAATTDALATRLDELAAEVTRLDEGPRVALVVAATTLKSAVERGKPFASELETYSGLAPNAAELDQLRGYAGSGIPTLTSLVDEATALASKIAAAELAPTPSAGFVDRLLSSARSFVTVRPVGEVAGDSTSAIAARIEAAVQQGNLETALAEFNSLPPEMQELGSDFAHKMRARQAADGILDKTLSNALKQPS